MTTAAWILPQTTIKVGTAIVQIPARTPAVAAMTAMTLDQLSDGRFILGIGASGPQVVEGWRGVPYGKPLTRTASTSRSCARFSPGRSPARPESGLPRSRPCEIGTLTRGPIANRMDVDSGPNPD